HKLASDLKDKDDKISAADEQAGKANEAAGKANERAAKLESEAADARRATEELRTANIEANRAFEKERRERLEMEASLADRIFDQQDTAVRSLMRFAGTVASVEYLNERECRETAEQINSVLADAK